MNVQVSLVCWFVCFKINIWETKGRGIRWVEQMTHSVSYSWNAFWQNCECVWTLFPVCVGLLLLLLTSVVGLMWACVCLFLVSLLWMHEVSKCCTHVYVMWCVFQTGLTFSCFKITLPGVGGAVAKLRWSVAVTHSASCEAARQSLTGLRYPGPHLVFGFPPRLFSAHMALYDICPSAFSQINTTRWARNGLGGEDCVHVSVSEVQQIGKMGTSGHGYRMVEIKRGFKFS